MPKDLFTWIGGAIVILAILTKVQFSGASYFGLPRWVGDVLLALGIAFLAIGIVIGDSTIPFQWRLVVWLAISAGLLTAAYFQKRANEAIADPPSIQISTITGLRPPATSEDVERARDHRFVIANNGKRVIHKLVMKVQFPEWILCKDNRDWTTGTHNGVSIKPLVAPPEPFRGNILTQSSETEWTAEAPSPDDIDLFLGVPAFQVEIAELYPNRPVELYVRSFARPGLGLVYFLKDGTTKPVENHICVSYQFEQRANWIEKTVVVPITYNTVSRAVAAGGIDLKVETCPPILTVGGGSRRLVKKKAIDGGTP